MAVKKVSPERVEIKKLPGREMEMLINKGTVGAEKISLVVIHVPPGETVRPCHAHIGIEEVIYISEGKGKAWVDGEVVEFKKGDAVFFPPGSKHMIKNIGSETMHVVCSFAPPSDPSQYKTYEDIEFKE